MSTEPGPATRRRQLGRQLRDLRLSAGISTMDVAAHRSGLSRATISRIESAKQAILPRNVRLLCQIYGISAPLLEHLVKIAEEAENRGWLVAYSDTVPDWFERYAAEEAEASEILMYQAEFVPGLLQTPAYCRVITNTASPGMGEVAEKHLEVRLARQALLNRDAPPNLRLVLNEAVIRRQVGGAEVMRGQLKQLAALARRPNITLQVLPFSAGAHPAMIGSFTMLRFPVENSIPTIFVEVDSGALYADRPTDVDRYNWVFGQLCDLALSPDESIALISRVEAEM